MIRNLLGVQLDQPFEKEHVDFLREAISLREGREEQKSEQLPDLRKPKIVVDIL